MSDFQGLRHLALVTGPVLSLMRWRAPSEAGLELAG